MKGHRVLAVTSILLFSATLLLACASSPQATSPHATPESPPGPSERYLTTGPEDGWIRTVGRNDGFVLVFETQETFEAAGAWDYRLVLFNESGSDVTWDQLLLGLRGRADGAPWDDFSIGLTGPYLTEPIPPVTLRSGESTTQELSQSLGDPPLEYEVVGMVLGYGGGGGLQSQTPTVTVISK
ncbi:MAG: hypothetical protein Q8K99_00850 [Actinomycetota bacterium]|nr:hypothetical protein [Actinomycetota bacterium]